MNRAQFSMNLMLLGFSTVPDNSLYVGWQLNGNLHAIERLNQKDTCDKRILLNNMPYACRDDLTYEEALVHMVDLCD